MALPRRSILRIAVALSAAIVLSLSACSSTTAPTLTGAGSTANGASPTTMARPSVVASVAPTTAAPVDSCTVITKSEAAAAIGENVTGPVRGKAVVEGGVACVYYGPSAIGAHNPDLAQFDTVRVVLVSGSDASKYFNDYKSKTNPKSIAGYGDQAFFEGASLSVLKGDEYLRVAVISYGNALSAEEQLAKAALTRM